MFFHVSSENEWKIGKWLADESVVDWRKIENYFSTLRNNVIIDFAASLQFFFKISLESKGKL